MFGIFSIHILIINLPDYVLPWLSNTMLIVRSINSLVAAFCDDLICDICLQYSHLDNSCTLLATGEMLLEDVCLLLYTYVMFRNWSIVWWHSVHVLVLAMAGMLHTGKNTLMLDTKGVYHPYWIPENIPGKLSSSMVTKIYCSSYRYNIPHPLHAWSMHVPYRKDERWNNRENN